MLRADLSCFDIDIETLENRIEPQGAVLFYGSSTITVWGHDRLKKQMKDITAVNCGFGGSTAEQALYYYVRIVKPRIPKALVWYEGDNDIACGYTPEETFFLTERLFSWVKKDIPGISIYILPPKNCPSRFNLIPKYNEYRLLLADYAKHNERVYYIDYLSMLYDKNNEIRKDIFMDDMLHFNDLGYIELSEIVYKKLKENLI